VEQALCLTLRAPSPNPVSARLFRPAEMKAPAYSVQPKAVVAPPRGAGSEHTAWRLIVCCGGGRCPREADRALVLPAELAAPLHVVCFFCISARTRVAIEFESSKSKRVVPW